MAQVNPQYIETIPARIAGIPCLIGVESYTHAPSFRGSPWKCDSADDYWGWTEAEWEVLDQRGRPAPWLQRKISQKDEDAISEMIDHHFAEERRQDRYEREIDRAMDASERELDRAMDLYEARFGL
ncbi:hypothetical protein [Thiobaca trueperi]|uniref:Uncharacterized protein n=1 Tax=Thiobaca trueperi TaxID=127458 RepID=A0A4R3N3E0_9GAMM|nr:hypothetical protein [Thiobaca trueperi]TCT21189.1 hypothetical protein EDC35_10442 [Thiobaca trueperi]